MFFRIPTDDDQPVDLPFFNDINVPPPRTNVNPKIFETKWESAVYDIPISKSSDRSYPPSDVKNSNKIGVAGANKKQESNRPIIEDTGLITEAQLSAAKFGIMGSSLNRPNSSANQRK